MLQFDTFGYMYPFTFSYFHLRNSIFTLSLWGVASIPKSVRGVAWYKRLKTPDLKQPKGTEEICSSTSETDEDEDMEMFEDFNDDGFIVSESMDPQNALALNLDISKMVTKIRRIVKIFKRSALKNETLQTYVKRIIQMH